jgi:signal transduction histidine kinase
VQLQGEDGKIILVVEDNGRGFMVDHYINLQREGAAEAIHSDSLKEHHLSNQDVPEPSKSGASGIGMLSVYNRVNYLNGKCSIQSAIGKGTAINIEIPVPAEEETNTKAVV